MVRVAPVNLAYNPHVLWFDPQDIEVHKGDKVVVETSRGTEFGCAVDDIIDVSKTKIKAMKSPLKPVKRIADENDIAQACEMEERGREALKVFKEEAERICPDMRPVSVEFLLDGKKAIFYFESEDRIDFRDLVHKLAARLQVRVDMRQIGVRDEARMVGGIGHCGQELCCKRFKGNFNPVSVRMAKAQDLSLNPQKISGLCGRLMCCLRYEYEAYKDFKTRAPKLNAVIQTPQGEAHVVELDVPREIIHVCIEDEKPIAVPLASFEEPKSGERPQAITEEGWEEALKTVHHGSAGDVATLLASATQLKGEDALAETDSVRHSGTKNRNGSASGRSGDSTGSDKKRRAGRSGSRQDESYDGYDGTSRVGTHATHRRRSTKISVGDASRETTKVSSPDRSTNTANTSNTSNTANAAKNTSKRKSKGNASDQTRTGGVRPGQKSSGLAHAENTNSDTTGNNASRTRETNRRRRRRNRNTQASSGEASQGSKEGK